MFFYADKLKVRVYYYPNERSYMSKSDDNTNELESYGVWVKNSNGNGDAAETPADTSDELNLDDGGLDLPDFDDSDFTCCGCVTNHGYGFGCPVRSSSGVRPALRLKAV